MLNEFLLRFREAAVPGPSAGGGAPADPTATLAAELEPVFALMEESERAADALEAEALGSAERRRADVTEQARLLIADARSRAPREQAAEAAAALARAAQTCAAIRARSAAETARIDAALEQRISPLVAEVARRIISGSGAQK